MEQQKEKITKEHTKSYSMSNTSVVPTQSIKLRTSSILGISSNSGRTYHATYLRQHIEPDYRQISY